MTGRKTHIIILNWNGGEDTWHCLASVLHMPSVRITILDNHSADDSVSYLEGQLKERQIGYTVLPQAGADALAANDDPVSLILSDENLGFAKGINRVLQPLLKTDTDYIWLLNNDAIALPDTLLALQEAMEAGLQVAFAGSVILDATQRGIVQCAGVHYYKWLGVARMQLKGKPWADAKREIPIMPKADFQHGASLLVRVEAIRKISGMDERFFLYSEEQDWQYRAVRAGYETRLAADSIIYHKGSMSTNSRRYLFFYHYCRSSVLFSRKHFPLLTALVATCMLAGITIIRTRLNLKSLGWGLKGMKEAWRFR